MKPYFQVTYFLWRSRADKSGNAPVYLRSNQNSAKVIAYHTGIRMHPLEWNNKTNQPRVKPKKLIDLEQKLSDTYKDLFAQGYTPTLKDLLAHKYDSRKPTGNIAEWCDDYIRSPYSPGQKKAVQTLKTNIEAWNKKISFDRLTQPMMKAFFAFLTQKKVANNSQAKRLFALINVANHANVTLPKYEIPYSTSNAPKPRLTWAEVRAIMDTEPIDPMEQIAKDVFLLACFSGLRISDILTIEKGELSGFFYEKRQIKTKEPVYVTVHQWNEPLFRKLIGGVPHTRQALSRALKPLLNRSGLTKPVTREQAVGSGYKSRTEPKYKFISFHSGRRFYARLLNDLGLAGEITRDELGHSYQSITEMYAGSPEHSFRITRVRKAMETLEDKMKELALMMVA